MVKNQKLVGRKRQLRVRLPLVVGEFDSLETVRRDVCEERDDIEQLWDGVHCLSPRSPNSIRIVDSGARSA